MLDPSPLSNVKKPGRMCEHFQSTLDKLVEMEKEPLAVGDYTVHLNTELSMVDRKMVDIM